MAKSGLKKGFTTGAAAAAAAEACLIAYCSDRFPETVTIHFLTGEEKTIPVHSIQKIKSHVYEALILKDGGDDPDVTHNALIGATVTIKKKDHNPDIIIKGGKGVGRITKPGLELPMGEPAINPGPRTMIEQAVHRVFKYFQITGKQVEVEVFVPKGEILAKKTLNARLGILGGISILGTTGVVTPMSHDAYIATIKAGIGVAQANGADTLVFTTGRRSERFAMDIFPDFSSEMFIQTGDFFKASLDMARSYKRIKQIIYTVFFGKAVKMAMGFEHTHAAKSELTLNRLSEWAQDITGNKTLVHQIRSANTARHAFEYIYPDHSDLIETVGRHIVKTAAGFSQDRLNIRAIIFDFNGKIAFDSKQMSKGQGR